MNTYPKGDAMIGLDWYIRAVARACGADESYTEVIDPDEQPDGTPVTANVPLDGAPPGSPAGQLLCLVWDEETGWSAQIARHPLTPPAPVAYLGGVVVPDPDAVAEFAEDLISGRRPAQDNPPAPTLRRAADHDDLDSQLTRYCVYSS